jgi:DNA-binding FadR family transcriptional regulator
MTAVVEVPKEAEGRLYEAVARSIVVDILANRYRFGQSLPNERELTAR